MRSSGVECAKIPASLRHKTCGHHRHLNDGMAIRALFGHAIAAAFSEDSGKDGGPHS